MKLKDLTTEQLLQLLQEIEDAEKTSTIAQGTLLRKYMNTLPKSKRRYSIAFTQAPKDIMKEISNRWKDTMNSITWIQGSGVGVIKKK